MAKITLSNLGRLDGDYELPTLQDLTNRELHFIRLQSGLTPRAIAGGVFELDTGLAVSLTAVALDRLEKSYDLGELWDAPFGAITIDLRDEEDEKPVPPEQPPSEQTEPESPGGNNDESVTSG